MKEGCGGPGGGPEDDLVAAVCVKLEDGAAQECGHRWGEVDFTPVLVAGLRACPSLSPSGHIPEGFPRAASTARVTLQLRKEL